MIKKDRDYCVLPVISDCTPIQTGVKLPYARDGLLFMLHNFTVHLTVYSTQYGD